MWLPTAYKAKKADKAQVSTKCFIMQQDTEKREYQMVVCTARMRCLSSSGHVPSSKVVTKDWQIVSSIHHYSTPFEQYMMRNRLGFYLLDIMNLLLSTECLINTKEHSLWAIKHSEIHMQLKLLKFNDPFEARARTNAKFIIKTPFVYTPGGVSSWRYMIKAQCFVWLSPGNQD